MATEYGFQSLPSIHTWATAADDSNPDDFAYGGKLLASRQHHPLGNFEMKLQVNTRLGRPRKSSAQQEFRDMIYLTQVIIFKVSVFPATRTRVQYCYVDASSSSH